MEVCRLESGGVPTADNWDDGHAGCDGSFGLFQIGCLHGVSREDLHNPITNIETAYKLWSTEGWHPWTTYKKIVMR